MKLDVRAGGKHSLQSFPAYFPPSHRHAEGPQLGGGHEALGGGDVVPTEAASGSGGRQLIRRAMLQASQPWLDVSRSFDARVTALLQQMQPAEKVTQMESTPAAAIPRLGVSTFNWQRECLHGEYPSEISWCQYRWSRHDCRIAGEVHTGLLLHTHC